MMIHERAAAIGSGMLGFAAVAAFLGVFVDGTAGGLLPGGFLFALVILGVLLGLAGVIGYAFEAWRDRGAFEGSVPPEGAE